MKKGVSLIEQIKQSIRNKSQFLPVENVEARSPLLSNCSTIFTSSVRGILAFLCAVVTISSKFILRWNNKNIFNPTNFGLVVMLVLSDQVWVSPGQWGSTAFIGFLVACVGSLVVNRASRSDVTYAFLFYYVTSLFGRALWLGDPISIPLHQFHNRREHICSRRQIL
jgi:enediyne biosynthesis protein E5